uniref:Uncharacterized protein n=1 Tax=Arundo donax TaxID=35708 RepID=A0A0A9A8Z0_ARUDO
MTKRRRRIREVMKKEES